MSIETAETMKQFLSGFTLISLFLLSHPGAASGFLSYQNYDFTGREVEITIEGTPKRIISTNGSTTENLLRLGLEKRMIGSAYQDNPVTVDLQDAYSRVPIISNKYPFREQVLALEPDFIYGWNTAFAPQAVGEVGYYHDMGVGTFIASNTIERPQRIENFISDMRLLGRIFRCSERAEELIAESLTKIDQVLAQVEDANTRPTVLIGQYRMNGIFSSYGHFTLMGEMVESLGAINLFREGGLHSSESLLGRNPDCIVVVHMFKTDLEVEEFLKLIRSHPVLSRLAAVSSGKLYPMPLAEVYAAGSRIPGAFQRLARFFYPGLFPDSEEAKSLSWEAPKN